MSGFKALNIESDDESDVEIDDTKELQIEEALKLYQTALKYHAEGPASFDLAAEAYEKLFQSDIFQYPESQTELRRIELYGAGPETDGVWLDDQAAEVVVASAALEGGPSTLPQILHLSHKNYGQFRLDYLNARLDNLQLSLNGILQDATTALDHFISALDKDDSDLDLWRRTAAVGGMLDSQRVTRFCLEAVLDGDEEGLSGVLSLPGLEESLAGEQLRELVQLLGDRVTMSQLPTPNGSRKALSKMLKNRLALYPQINDRERTLRIQEHAERPHLPVRKPLSAPKTWAGLGELLLSLGDVEQREALSGNFDQAIYFDLDPVERPMLTQDGGRVTAQRESPQLPGVHDMEAQESVTLQFPGTDQGKPTVEPQISPADVEMRSLVEQSQDGDDANMNQEAEAVQLPTRKRSGDVAGVTDGTEEGRAKSKRTRTRDSTITDENKQALIDANTRWEYEQQLNEFQAADDWTFETTGNLFERIGIVGLEAGKNVRQEFPNSPLPDGTEPVPSESQPKTGLKLAKSDIHAFLKDYSDRLGSMFISQGEEIKFGQGSDLAGIAGGNSISGSSKKTAKAPMISDDGVYSLLATVNDGWMLVQDVAWEWLLRLLRPHNAEHRGNTYSERTWPEDLKTMVVRVLINFDSIVFDKTQELLEGWKEHVQSDEGEKGDNGLVEMIQTTFELHLDIYCLIKEHNSGVDFETVTAQSERLLRWSELAREAMHFRSTTGNASEISDGLLLRFLWAMTFYLGASADVSQEHVIACMNDLRLTLSDVNEPVVHLLNNAVMPEISVAALDRETSRLATKDFFLKVSSPGGGDPVLMIENLEPLLESLETIGAEQHVDAPLPPGITSELVKYVENSDMSVRLMLWRRLRDAYTAIDYKAMVISCYFRTMKLVLDEMKVQIGSISTRADRQVVILKSLGMLKEMIVKSLALIQGNDNAFECIDEALLKSSVSMFGEILQLIQVFNLSEDSIRVGQTQAPTLPNGLPVASFATMNSQLHQMQIHVWIIMYRLLKEAMFQFHDLFPTPKEDQFDFLRALHRNLGLRGICGASNRALVRMLKDEFLHMTHVENYDSEQAQVLYDLYGLNCFLDPNYELIEHRCTHDAFLDRGVAAQVVDLLLIQASKLPIKDLIKHPLKDTIDKVHGSVGRKKPTDVILRNREVFRAYLRSAINPLDLYSCLKGEGNQLPVSPVPKADAVHAAKGWYFLMGHIALTKFRSQKRTAPTPTEDVDIAIAFFVQDLEYSVDNWETWFRLAQAYDTKIEESVVWSAEKLNSNMLEIVTLQRNAIHCYTMATALAYRSADLTFETTEKMTELYYEFALRIYASSREPFNMLPFAVDENEKFFSVKNGVNKGKPFQPLRVYTAWKFAKNLLQRAMEGRSQSWMVHYMLGKCLWKMHSASDEVRSHDVPPSHQAVLDCFIKAIELVPDKKYSREKREPVLEPHYKLVSIVNKLVKKGTIGLEEAKQALDHTSYAKNATPPQEDRDWIPYVLAILKSLRTADKSNWHHRMIVRAASIIYDDPNQLVEDTDSSEHQGALGAKNELTQQMFTKTMVLQVWRPDCERAGRHFVYTARYTRFFVQILEQLKDRSNLEMLAKRVRRRPHDLFEHALVWQDICNAWLRLLRSHAGISKGLETSTFSNIVHEDFVARRGPMEVWMQSQESGTTAALDVLREVQELKKINQSLMKPSAIDDLIGDSYAHLFATVGKQLWDETRRQQQEDERRQKEEEEARPQPVQPTPVPPRNPMMSLTNLMNVDGTDDNATTASGSTALAPPSSAPATKPSTPQPGDSSAAAPPASRRKIGVGRREIRNCAEACFQKPASASANTAQAVNIPQSKLPRVQVVIDVGRHNGGAPSSADTSRRGSVQGGTGRDDDDDDESELSELEEEDEEGEGGEERNLRRDDDEEEDGNDGDDEGEGGDSHSGMDVDGPPISPSATNTAKRRPMFPGLLQSFAVNSRDSSAGADDAPDGRGEDHQGGNTAPEVKEEGNKRTGEGDDEDVQMKDVPDAETAAAGENKE